MLLTDDNNYAKTATWTTSQEGRTKRMLKPSLFVIITSDATYCGVFFKHISYLCPLHSLPYTNELSSGNFYLPIWSIIPNVIWSVAFHTTMSSPFLKWLTLCLIGRSAEEDQVTTAGIIFSSLSAHEDGVHSETYPFYTHTLPEVSFNICGIYQSSEKSAFWCYMYVSCAYSN